MKLWHICLHLEHYFFQTNPWLVKFCLTRDVYEDTLMPQSHHQPTYWWFKSSKGHGVSELNVPIAVACWWHWLTFLPTIRMNCKSDMQCSVLMDRNPWRLFKTIVCCTYTTLKIVFSVLAYCEPVFMSKIYIRQSEIQYTFRDLCFQIQFLWTQVRRVCFVWW